MIHLLAGLPAVLRHWKSAAFAVAILFAAFSHLMRLSTERRLDRCRGEAAIAEHELERSEAAIAALRRDSLRRSAEQARLVDEAERRNKSEQYRIEALQRTAQSPVEGDRCRLSDALRQAEEGL